MHQLGPVYEDPDAFKLDPHTQDNLAYVMFNSQLNCGDRYMRTLNLNPRLRGTLLMDMCSSVSSNSESLIIVHGFNFLIVHMFLAVRTIHAFSLCIFRGELK